MPPFAAVGTSIARRGTRTVTFSTPGSYQTRVSYTFWRISTPAVSMSAAGSRESGSPNVAVVKTPGCFRSGAEAVGVTRMVYPSAKVPTPETVGSVSGTRTNRILGEVKTWIVFATHAGRRW